MTAPPPMSRLRELARERVNEIHGQYFARYNVYESEAESDEREKRQPKHTKPIATCPHPDCVLVRELEPPTLDAKPPDAVAEKRAAYIEKLRGSTKRLSDRAAAAEVGVSVTTYKAEPPSGWRPISEAQKDGTRILVRYYDCDCAHIIQWDTKHQRWEDFPNCEEMNEPDVWQPIMPLPEPPAPVEPT